MHYRLLLSTLLPAALCVTPAALAQQFKKAVADDIFADHPSMDRNAVVMPAADAKPIMPFFSERPIGDASIAMMPDGGFILTGTTLRSYARHGVELWTTARDATAWKGWGPARISGNGIVPGDVSERYLAPSVTVAGDRLYLAFSDKTGCARIAAGAVADPGGSFAASPCLVEDAADASLFVDRDGAGYLLWGGGYIARLKPGFAGLAEAPRFLKPDQKLFAEHPPVGKDWPVRTRVGRAGTTMFRDGDRYVLAASEVTGRMRTATEDLFMAEAPTPYGPFTRRMLAVPHAGRGSVVRFRDGRLAAAYNPRCDDGFALFCEQVGLVPLERAPDGRLRQAASAITEDSAVAARKPLITGETMRDPSVTLGGDGYYYLVGTLDGYGYHKPEGGVKLWRSADLERWDEVGFVWRWQGMGYDFGKNIAELWAPEIKWVERDKTFYLAFSVMERGVGGKTWLYRSTSGKAEGPYANVTKSYLVEGIDGFPFEDDDGLYFLWGGGRIARLNAARDGFDGPVRKLVDVDGDAVGYEGNGLIKVNGVYFLTGAEWHGPLRTHGTYDMMYGTSKSLFGPYSQRRMGAPHGGHGTAFADKQGRYWYTMFGNDPTAPWRMQFGLVPIDIGDPASIGVPRIGTLRD
ncbi:family 43 glycosylhydrolase [Sphingomonas sp. DG1-23]|uniref:family 43 glycosylhydrolase n=1 Tax=Sphingomonas sp. DG1-23 TaxID=3068316 RepID=UPI0027402761|nr:family 43 glycosylhydrolase [Sphingomonas sp. DG1-23]MDP5278737.1 family 43 glycosylhydrolase [Sphingomonas sp. DG1-23]